ncbi:hypothetical protein VT84_33265 [Gemmata sp. SH-PL17]|uniref:hypothetical protein n=1 Tax=Gemmata sp. SH-PL17 TaxID=1630693 RepID=UPI00078D3795|nr:hypothetical protein [Gemmata sp. SH-PL17]AMV29313.1 hypothetical protein VT84_33265 [Gemmata sp. SH-PL17]
MSKKKLTEAERLTHACPKCGARPGFTCLDYKDQPAPLCVERGRPEITAKKLQKKADERNARALASVGGDNTLLTFLHDGADNLLAAEGLRKVNADDIAAEKLRNVRLGAESGGRAEHRLREGLNWITLRYMRRVAAELLGVDAESRIWAHAERVYQTNLDHIFSSYGTALCSTGKIDLALELRFDPARVKEWEFKTPDGRVVKGSNDGRYLVVTDRWPPDGYTPVMTREEFRAKFETKGMFWRPPTDLPEPDDGGLFERTIGALGRAA